MKHALLVITKSLRVTVAPKHGYSADLQRNAANRRQAWILGPAESRAPRSEHHSGPHDNTPGVLLPLEHSLFS